MSNYPDDIRQYDHDPRSPFFSTEEDVCWACDRELEEDEGTEIRTKYSGIQFICDDCLDTHIREGF